MDKFKMLMAVRTTFGPDSLLWNLCSSEGLCYDWLQFKSQEPEQPFTAFVRLLMGWEAAQIPDHRVRALFCQRVESFLAACGEKGGPGRSWRSRKPAPPFRLLPVPRGSCSPRPTERNGRSGSTRPLHT
jgi:hypothetical protein